VCLDLCSTFQGGALCALNRTYHEYSFRNLTQVSFHLQPTPTRQPHDTAPSDNCLTLSCLLCVALFDLLHVCRYWVPFYMQALQSKVPGPGPPPKHESSPRHHAARVNHACDRCRLMRTKCSGGERCSKCIKDDTPCGYGDGKREKIKKY
jgi:hypothetical protein